MTHEQRAIWIRRGIILSVSIGVLLGVWLFPEKKPEAKPVAAAAGEAKHLIEILHFHLPGNPESEVIAGHLAKVQTKYGEQLLVTRVDVQKDPERAKAEKVTKPPKVVMMAGTVRACKFQGVWTQVQIERKVDEILHGLKRMGKDWRPDVQGMQSAQQAAAVPAAQPAQVAQAAQPAPAQAPAKAAPPATPAQPGGPPPGMSRSSAAR
jgi:hypothetical protein